MSALDKVGRALVKYDVCFPPVAGIVEGWKKPRKQCLRGWFSKELHLFVVKVCDAIDLTSHSNGGFPFEERLFG